jgi:hypothetical protein
MIQYREPAKSKQVNRTFLFVRNGNVVRVLIPAFPGRIENPAHYPFRVGPARLTNVQVFGERPA